MPSKTETPPLSPPARAHFSNKIPAIGALFWAMKIVATTLGETGGDLLSKTPAEGALGLGYGVASTIFLGFFVVTLAVQLAAKRYVPALFWGVIVSTSTFGTAMSDYLNRTVMRDHLGLDVGLAYTIGSALLVGLLLSTLLVWRASERTLSVDRIETRRGEVFYWGAILISNTLGTSLGDFIADDSGLGFAGGAAIVGGLLVLVLAATYLTKLSRVALFWIAFVLTRPFGAQAGDVLMREHDEGGLDLGIGQTSAVLAAILVVLVAIETWRQRRKAEAADAA